MMYIKFRTNLMAPGQESICKVEPQSRDSWADDRAKEWSVWYGRKVIVEVITSWEEESNG